jgi:hypothetical protein
VDLALYGRVLRRFRWLVALGLVLAVFLAVLSVAKITSHGISYRKPAIYQSTTTLLLTQNGFPWGRTTLPGMNALGFSSKFADPTRFSSLTDLYSQFANSDQVRALMLRAGAPLTWGIQATPVQATSSAGILPVISLAGRAETPADAVRATQVGRTAFIKYVTDQQARAGIPDSQRIDIQVLQEATPPSVVQPHKKTLPIVVFLAVISATIGLAFVLENVRPVSKRVAIAPPERPGLETAPARSRAEA